ncbi:GNAT family N-acetyltransferase [Chitinophaga vietnamensis]|uniref:GNAT family N-acetyltransferase n=1 Tax=Chitinophaga vietnamensis TaxID=2593957 RepID=UPI0011785755|nr:GNAT family N-acetyltransferase [Chitinophaga vietnamensis]
METIAFTTFIPAYEQQVATLITNIQQKEFGVPITFADQPDLSNIPSFYQQGKGNFWCALNQQSEVVGTIALIDTGSNIGAIRKMFVRADYRGKEKNVAAQLLQILESHAQNKGLKQLYLGTVPLLKAALRFYEKNGYEPVAEQDLPPQFPKMAVDTVFFKKIL